jgi:N-[(2S)-2-amino-2-carboxyethyl]-L-glutamate dehydrogenase
MQAKDDGLLYLSSSDVLAASADVDPLRCVGDALLQHAAGTAKVGVEGVIRWSPESGHSARTLNMPGLLGDGAVVGTKIINANTGNPDHGLPRADGLTILFDPRSARPRAVLQGAHISALRTAAVSTLAARELVTGDPVTLGVVGAGKIAHAHITLMAEHLKIGRVLLSDRQAERAHALAASLRDDGLVPQIAVTDVENAVRDGNVVVTATTASQAYVSDDWIAPGTTVINVSLDDIEEATYLRADLLYVDDWPLVTDDTQRLLGRLARAGKVTGPGQAAPDHGRSVTGTLGQLLTRACPSRQAEAQTIVVNPFGMAIEDLAIAHEVVAAAESRGLGVTLPR